MSLFDMDHVRMLDLQASGQFGRMYSAVYQDLLNCEEKTIVVKTLTKSASKSAQSAFVRQGLSLQGLQHAHLLSCTLLAKDGRPPMLLYSQLEQRNLKHVLRQRQNQSASSSSSSGAPIRLLQPRLLVRLAIQLADAIRYVHDHCLLHKDVAARNCYVSGLDDHVARSNRQDGDKVVLRLADNALSRDLFAEDYVDSSVVQSIGGSETSNASNGSNRLAGRSDEGRPVRWMSYETLMGSSFSRANDVWSFAVTVWEMLTLAELPYESIGTNEIAKLLWYAFVPLPLLCT
jgi:serine/threonine protein kinase